MALSANSKTKSQQKKPLFYKDDFDDKDSKIRLDSNVVFAEETMADLLISGFTRRHVFDIIDIPMIIVSITTKMLNESPHLPHIMQSLIPMTKIFNKQVLDLKTPKFSDLSVCQRTVLRLFLQWRLNLKSEIIGSPKASLSSLILSGNNQHFGDDGCFWLKQVIPYHPEITEIYIDSNNINDDGLLLIIKSLSLRHDSAKIKSVYPIKELHSLNLSNNNFTDIHIAKLLYSLSVYTPNLRELDLSYNGLTNTVCAAICCYLDELDEKKCRKLKKLILRHNQIDFDGVKELNESVEDLPNSWKIKVEIGSNPTKQLYTFDANEKVEIDHRINLYGA